MISELILRRTRHGVKVLITSHNADKKNRQEGKEQKTKSQRKVMKEIERYLQENKKMYKIISKILSSQIDKLAISSMKIVESIFSFDGLESPYVSIYLLREIINLSPIMQITLKSEEEWRECTETLFGYLMKIK